MKRFLAILLLCATVLAAKAPPQTWHSRNDTDPYFSSVKLLLHCNGSSNTFIDSSTAAHTITAIGGATQTTGGKWNNGGFFATASDYLTLDGNSDFAFSGDFAIELWLKLLTAPGASKIIYDSRPTGGSGAYPTLYLNPTGQLAFFHSGANKIIGTTVLATNTWYFICLTRTGTDTKLFLNNSQEGSTYTSDSTSYLNGTARPSIATLGSLLGNNACLGMIDDLRVTLHSRDGSVPTAQFTDQ